MAFKITIKLLALSSFTFFTACSDQKDSDSTQTNKEQEKPIESIGLIACVKHYKPLPALEKYTELNPDLLLWMGDNIYSDTTDVVKMENDYKVLAATKGFQSLKDIPFMATWDDHDFGINNGGDSHPTKAGCQKVFMDFWKFPKERYAQKGVYSSNIFGPIGKRLQVIMLDGRYAKTSQRMLDEAQWEWLAKELEKEADLRFIVSGQQVLVSQNTVFECWEEIGNEKQRLFDLIKKKNVNNVLFLSGDQHYAEVSKIDGALGYDAWEFTFAGVNQDERHSKNDYRHGEVVHEKDKYCQLQIKWENDPAVTFKVYNLSGETIHSTSVKLSELKR